MSDAEHGSAFLRQFEWMTVDIRRMQSAILTLSCRPALSFTSKPHNIITLLTPQNCSGKGENSRMASINTTAPGSRSSLSPLIKLLDPPSLGPPNPVFSNVTVVSLSDTVQQINIAGQVATTPDGEVPDGLEAQMDLCLSKVATCLDAAGATVHDLTRLNYYFVRSAWPTDGLPGWVVEKAERWLQGHRPASVCLILAALSDPRFLCEFEAHAVIRTRATVT